MDDVSVLRRNCCQKEACCVTLNMWEELDLSARVFRLSEVDSTPRGVGDTDVLALQRRPLEHTQRGRRRRRGRSPRRLWDGSKAAYIQHFWDWPKKENHVLLNQSKVYRNVTLLDFYFLSEQL